MPAKMDYWTRKEVVQLTRLRNEGVEVEVIARELLRTPAAVKQKLLTLGLTEVKRDDERWSIEEDGRLLRYRQKLCSIEWISLQLRRTPMAIVARLEKLRNPTRISYVRGKATVNRECLCCRQLFRSTGPGNRLCQDCRNQSLTRFDTPARVMR